MKHTVFLFGEAEKGEFGIPLICKTLPQLADTVGNPPMDSLGIEYAIQTLLYQRELVFFRVKEEGYSTIDYMKGLRWLKKKEFSQVSAICIPGVGDGMIIEIVSEICQIHKSLLVISEKDLYDYLTSLPKHS